MTYLILHGFLLSERGSFRYKCFPYTCVPLHIALNPAVNGSLPDDDTNPPVQDAGALAQKLIVPPFVQESGLVIQAEVWIPRSAHWLKVAFVLIAPHVCNI